MLREYYFVIFTSARINELVCFFYKLREAADVIICIFICPFFLKINKHQSFYVIKLCTAFLLFLPWHESAFCALSARRTHSFLLLQMVSHLSLLLQNELP